MKKELVTDGIVLMSSPQGENDRRLTLLTSEQGKLTVFAPGARKAGGRFTACSNVFSFGTFTLAEGKSAYRITDIKNTNYFTELSRDYNAMCYASYFVEFSDYYAYAGIDCSEMVKLLYASFVALTKESFENRLVRRVFEIRMLCISGEFNAESIPMDLSDSARYALSFIQTEPIKSLYSFALDEATLYEVERVADYCISKRIDKSFKSLEFLDIIIN